MTNRGIPHTLNKNMGEIVHDFVNMTADEIFNEIYDLLPLYDDDEIKEIAEGIEFLVNYYNDYLHEGNINKTFHGYTYDEFNKLVKQVAENEKSLSYDFAKWYVTAPEDCKDTAYKYITRVHKHNRFLWEIRDIIYFYEKDWCL